MRSAQTTAIREKNQAQSSAADVLAGLAVAGLILPEAVAYAGIAGLAPGHALAAGIAGGLAYALAGRSRFAIVAPTSSSAAILAAVPLVFYQGIASGILIPVAATPTPSARSASTA